MERKDKINFKDIMKAMGWKEWALLCCLTALCLLSCHSICHHWREPHEPLDTKTTVEYRYDTIPVYISKPVLKDSVVIRYITAKLPIKEEASAENNGKDSVEVEIPITQKIYQDSTYTAWVSGYHPNLDSLIINQPVTTITITNETTKYKKHRWGLGVQGGIGITSRGQFEPYIGIGVTYNILTW